MAAVQIHKGFDDSIPLYKQAGVGEELKQATADNFKAFFGASRSPGGFDATDRIFEPVEGFLTAIAPNLNIGRRNTDHQQGVFGILRRFAEGLGKGELGIETAPCQVRIIVQLTGIGHPFIDQDQTGGIAVKQVGEGITGIGGGFVGLPHQFIALRATQLPGQFAPEGFNQRALGRIETIGHNAAGLELVAY